VSLLSRILGDKRAEVDRSRRRLPESELRRLSGAAGAPRDFAGALARGSGPRVIAEVKRASPSRGVLRPKDPPGSWQPEALAAAYERGGASCLSVLTDTPYFWGSPDHLGAARAAVALPVLRKEFVVDAYQVLESRWLGADAVLLIAAVLEPALLRECAALASELGMAALIEVHADAELDTALSVPAAVIGINHRNLDTLNIDMNRALALRPRIPKGRVVVAESGVSDRASIEKLRGGGIDNFLVGESIAASDDPEAALRRLLGR
jgi:indole-3-glycerol phosphate synthase